MICSFSDQKQVFLMEGKTGWKGLSALSKSILDTQITSLIFQETTTIDNISIYRGNWGCYLARVLPFTCLSFSCMQKLNLL